MITPMIARWIIVTEPGLQPACPSIWIIIGSSIAKRISSSQRLSVPLAEWDQQRSLKMMIADLLEVIFRSLRAPAGQFLTVFSH